jgi:hypothetical protein
MLEEWKLSNRRCAAVLSGFAALSGILGVVQFRMNGDGRWIIGGLTILTNWPYVYSVMVPVNIWPISIPLGKPASPVAS